jgi:hypothetical protein
MSLARLRTGEWLAAAGAVALAVSLFALHFDNGASPRDGWQALPALRWLLLVTVVVVLCASAAQARRGPGLAAALDVVALPLCGLTVLLLVIRLATTGASLGVGAFVGLAASLVMTAGVYAALRTEQGWPPGPDRPIEVIALGSPDDA